jgi:hypothetical protein
MGQDKSIVASFSELPPAVLGITGVGQGAVSVDGTPRALPWSGLFAIGSPVTLEALPDSGWQFDGWSGDVSDSANPTTITIEADAAVTANFAEVQYALSLSGDGAGSVLVDGAVCSLPWSSSFVVGSMVTLQAVPDAGWQFDGWSGGLAGDDNPAAVVVDGDTSIAARFSQLLHTLTVAVSGDGWVTLDGEPIPAPYLTNIADGTAVTLEATPEYGWRFDGWSGSMIGTETSLSLTMHGDESITAVFILPDSYTLGLSKTGAGSVKVNGTEVSLPWSADVTRGAEVTLEAAAQDNEEFLGWCGDLSGDDSPVTITMDGDKSIAASFACLATFPDVPCDHWAVNAVEGLYGAGLVFGYPDGFYRPDWAVDRAAMAVYVARSLGAGGRPSAPAVTTFPDVPTDHWAHGMIEFAVAGNIVEGYPDGEYHPNWRVTRGQMAVFIARAMAFPQGEEGISQFTPPETPTFPDVPTDYWSYLHVEYLVENGGINGYPDGRYRPSQAVTRDQMAVYIARASGLM